MAFGFQTLGFRVEGFRGSGFEESSGFRDSRHFWGLGASCSRGLPGFSGISAWNSDRVQHRVGSPKLWHLLGLRIRA